MGRTAGTFFAINRSGLAGVALRSKPAATPRTLPFGPISSTPYIALGAALAAAAGASAYGSSLVVGASVAASGDGGKPLWLVQDLTNTAATLRWHAMACS